MDAVRRALLLLGLVGLLGGVSQIAVSPPAAPWSRLERHVQQTLGTGGILPAVRVDLGRSYVAWAQSALTEEKR